MERFPLQLGVVLVIIITSICIMLSLITLMMYNVEGVFFRNRFTENEVLFVKDREKTSSTSNAWNAMLPLAR